MTNFAEIHKKAIATNVLDGDHYVAIIVAMVPVSTI